MRGKSFITIALTAAVGLLMLNMAFTSRADERRNSGEISTYEYTKLETALAGHPELAEAVSRKSPDGRVTAADYDELMRRIERKTARR